MTQPGGIQPIFVGGNFDASIIPGDLEVQGNATFDQNVLVKGTLSANTFSPGTITTPGNANVGGNLVVGGNSTTTGNTVTGGSTTTGAPLHVTYTNTASNIPVVISDSTIGTGNFMVLALGAANTTNNSTYLGFANVGGTGSTTNYAYLGLDGETSLEVNGLGNVVVPGTLNIGTNSTLVNSASSAVSLTLPATSGTIALVGGGGAGSFTTLTSTGATSLATSTGSVTTKNNTLDNGSGNATIAGTLGVTGVLTTSAGITDTGPLSTTAITSTSITNSGTMSSGATTVSGALTATSFTGASAVAASFPSGLSSNSAIALLGGNSASFNNSGNTFATNVSANSGLTGNTGVSLPLTSGTLLVSGGPVTGGAGSFTTLTSTGTTSLATSSGTTTTKNQTLDDGSGNATISNVLTLSNTSPLILTNTGTNLAAPSVTTRSLGTRMVLNNTLSGTSVDYAMGVSSSVLWWSIPTTGFYNWFSGTAATMFLTGGGNLTLSNGGLTVTTNVTSTFGGPITVAGLITGNGGCTINGSGGSGQIVVNATTAAEASLGVSKAGTRVATFGYSSADGCFIFDNVNSAYWLQQGGSTNHRVASFNNVLDSGTGGATFAGSVTAVTFTPNTYVANMQTNGSSPATLSSSGVSQGFTLTGGNTITITGGTTANRYLIIATFTGPVTTATQGIITITGTGVGITANAGSTLYYTALSTGQTLTANGEMVVSPSTTGTLGIQATVNSGFTSGAGVLTVRQLV